MKNVYFVLEKEYSLLNEIVADLDKAGYIVFNIAKYENGEHVSGEKKNAAFVITDCEWGISYAHENDLGYVFIENEESYHPDAQCIVQSVEALTPDFVLKMYQRYNNIPWTVAETENFYIKESSLEDLDRFYEIYNDDKIRRFCQNLSDDRKLEEEIQKAYIDNMYKFFGFGVWKLERKTDGNIVGRAGLFLREQSDSEQAAKDDFDGVELGYLIEKSERGKGYAYECCRKIIEIAREEYGFERIRCIIDSDNTESINLAKKLGFSYVKDIELEQMKQRIYENV